MSAAPTRTATERTAACPHCGDALDVFDNWLGLTCERCPVCSYNAVCTGRSPDALPSIPIKGGPPCRCGCRLHAAPGRQYATVACRNRGAGKAPKRARAPRRTDLRARCSRALCGAAIPNRADGSPSRAQYCGVGCREAAMREKGQANRAAQLGRAAA